MSIDSEVRTTWYLCCDADGCDASEDFTVSGDPVTSEARMWVHASDAGWTGDAVRCYCPEHGEIKPPSCKAILNP